MPGPFIPPLSKELGSFLLPKPCHSDAERGGGIRLRHSLLRNHYTGMTNEAANP